MIYDILKQYDCFKNYYINIIHINHQNNSLKKLSISLATIYGDFNTYP
jgi:hypothetical protein